MWADLVKAHGETMLWKKPLPWGSRGSRSVAKLMTGTVIAQVLLVGVSPILTRIYEPAELGALASFMALVSVFSLVATGSYAQAVVLPQEDGKAVSLVFVGLVMSFLVSMLCLVSVMLLVYATGSPFSDLTWLLWLPLAVFAAAANTVFVAYANRNRRYGLMASSTVIKSVTQAFGQVGLGLVAPAATSLVGALTVGSVAGTAPLSRNFIAAVRSHRTSKAEMKAVASEYSIFPRYTLPAGLLSQVQFAGLPLIIGSLFGAATLGLWSIAFRVISVPLTLIGGSVADVYYRRAIDLKDSREAAVRLYRKVLIRLSLVSLPPFVMLAIFAPVIFAFVFGPAWKEAGEFARVMTPLLWVRFLTNPVSRTNLVYGRNRLGLWIQMSLALAVLLPSFAAWLLAWDFYVFLTVFAWIGALVYAGALIVYARVIVRSPSTSNPKRRLES